MAYEPHPPPLIDKVLAEIFDIPLSNAGFVKIRSRFYVRTRLREMNDVIEFHRGNLELVFVWGPSLNFVPHITKGVENVRWHRTPKSAVIDLRYSGSGKKPETGWSIQTTHGERALRQSAQVTRSEMLPKALAYFDSVRVLSDLSAKFREAALPDKWGFSLATRSHEHLAYCFYLAKSGREYDGRKMMSAWLSRSFNSFRPETLEKLSQLFEQAAKSPVTLQ